MPVRVLIIHPRDLAAPTLGGIQTFLHDLVKHAPPDFEITLAGVTSDPRQRPVGLRRPVRVEGRQAWQLPLAREGRLTANPLELGRMLVGQVRLRRLLMDRGTIVQVHRPYRSAVLAGIRGPRVQFVHLDVSQPSDPTAVRRFGRLYDRLEGDTLSGAARVFVVNEQGVEQLRRAHPQLAERIEFLPVWYDDEVWRPPAPAERSALRHALAIRLKVPSGAAAEEAWILFAGRLDDNKAPGLALDALAELVGGGRAARLLVAGDGELRTALVAQAAELGVDDRVHLLGDLPREQLAELMRTCDALLLTSRAEGGGPRVVLEALASGLPVVATTVGDIRRTVTSGANGWLAEERRADRLAAGLGWVLDQPPGRLAGAAVDAARPYTAARVLARVYEVYRILAGATDR